MSYIDLFCLCVCVRYSTQFHDLPPIKSPTTFPLSSLSASKNYEQSFTCLYMYRQQLRSLCCVSGWLMVMEFVSRLWDALVPPSLTCGGKSPTPQAQCSTGNQKFIVLYCRIRHHLIGFSTVMARGIRKTVQ